MMKVLMETSARGGRTDNPFFRPRRMARANISAGGCTAGGAG
jgi:hypothetical protein